MEFLRDVISFQEELSDKRFYTALLHPKTTNGMCAIVKKSMLPLQDCWSNWAEAKRESQLRIENS